MPLLWLRNKFMLNLTITSHWHFLAYINKFICIYVYILHKHFTTCFQAYLSQMCSQLTVCLPFKKKKKEAKKKKKKKKEIKLTVCLWKVSSFCSITAMKEKKARDARFRLFFSFWFLPLYLFLFFFFFCLLLFNGLVIKLSILEESYWTNLINNNKAKCSVIPMKPHPAFINNSFLSIITSFITYMANLLTYF